MLILSPLVNDVFFASMKALQNCREMGCVSAARGSRVEPQ